MLRSTSKRRGDFFERTTERPAYNEKPRGKHKNRSTVMSQQKGQALQDPFLNTLRKEHVPVSIFLVNGI
jgi:hypothetical protein